MQKGDLTMAKSLNNQNMQNICNKYIYYHKCSKCGEVTDCSYGLKEVNIVKEVSIKCKYCGEEQEFIVVIRHTNCK